MVIQIDPNMDLNLDPSLVAGGAGTPAPSAKPRPASPPPPGRPARRRRLVAAAVIVALVAAGFAAWRFLRRRGAGPDGYSIAQAISDRAQLTTLAFDALAFVTGTFGEATFLPPGKVCDFFGFQYMRDVDRGELGHNPVFVPRAANAMLAILNDAQRAELVTVARAQAPRFKELVRLRYPLIKAYFRERDGDRPAGSAGLDAGAVRARTGDVFALDGELALERAECLGRIYRSLDAGQRAKLARCRFDDSGTWPEIADVIDRRGMPREEHVAVMTFASEMFSWFLGSVEADTYFCPERHGTYFGSFYMKDIPAMDKGWYSISTALTGDSGEAFLKALTPVQRKRITGLVGESAAALKAIVETRRAIAVELRRFLKEESIDREKVGALARRYGELDGEISFRYATRFSEVAKLLDAAQRKRCMDLRNLDGYACSGAFEFSDPAPLPETLETDSLFGAPAVGQAGAKEGTRR